MAPVLFFESISIPIPRKNIYRRLGFVKGVTEVPASQQEEIERYIGHASSLIHLKGAGLRMPIKEIKGSRIILPDGAEFESRQLAKFLANCDEIVLMGATAGREIMNAIEEDATGANVTRGIVLDAAASEIVDASLDWIVDYFNQSLRRENRRLLGKRYSAGYGDLFLETQKAMYRLLQLDRIGIEITESCMLIPEKSVTAITGIESHSFEKRLSQKS
ncbi:methionine synthase [bacterium]|nr:MAG: methionine synthase [bacterium]